jgi:hypothetical protein
MDIHLINSNNKVNQDSHANIRRQNGFKRVFAKELDKINTALPRVPLGFKGDILEKSELILFLLEEYARGLSDPGRSLSDIEPLVEGIKEGMSLIEAEASEKGLGDSGLGRLIRELAVTANVAVFKFYRGDYI